MLKKLLKAAVMGWLAKRLAGGAGWKRKPGTAAATHGMAMAGLTATAIRLPSAAQGHADRNGPAALWTLAFLNIDRRRRFACVAAAAFAKSPEHPVECSFIGNITWIFVY